MFTFKIVNRRILKWRRI